MNNDTRRVSVSPDLADHQRSGHYTVIIGRTQLLQRFAHRLSGISAADREHLVNGLCAIETAARGLAGMEAPGGESPRS